MHIPGFRTFRQFIQYTDDIGHQGAATGPQFHQCKVSGIAEGLPGLGDPDAQQLAKDLGDFWRRGEVARRAEWIAVHVIAKFRMAETKRHIAVNRQGAFLLDCRHKDGLQRCHAVRRDRNNNQMPTATKGSDNAMPMVKYPAK